MTEWRGDARFTQLARTHGDTLIRLAILLTGNQHDAEDAVQEALIAVAAKWPGVRSLAYVKRTVANKSMDVLRRRHDILSEHLPESLAVESGYFRFDDDEAFFARIRSLPERQRATIVLRYHADLDDRDIARILGCGVETVRSQAHRGLAKLREAALETQEER